MKKKPVVALYLDKRRIKKNGEYPVKIRVTYKRKTKYFPTNINLSLNDFESVLKCELLWAKNAINEDVYISYTECLSSLKEDVKIINNHIKNIGNFSFLQLELLLKEKENNKELNVGDFLIQIITDNSIRLKLSKKMIHRYIDEYTIELSS